MEILQPTTQVFTQGSARMRLLQKIKDSGFETQNQQLLQLGFTKYSQNLKYLKEFKGDLETVSSELLERKSLKEKKKNEMEIENEGGQNKELRKFRNKERKPKGEKIKKERVNKVSLKEYAEWPTEIETIYLDGNNMLFVEDAIRKKVLGRRKRAGEKILAALALEFCKLNGRFNIVLIFDNTNLTYTDKVEINGKVLNFEVVSAIPKFPDSDDALVHWSSELGEKKNHCLFVTSDRGLQDRLDQNGIENIMKPKKWFGFVKNQLCEEAYRAILTKEEKEGG